MVPLLLSLLGNKWVWVALALAGTSGWAWIQGKRLDSAQTSLEAVRGEYAGFKSQVAQLGREAKERAEKKRLEDLQRAKEADNEARKRYADLDAAYVAYRLRVRAGSGPTQRIVSAAPTSTPSDQGICYSRDTLNSELTAAVGRLRAGLALDSEPFDKAAIMAKTCRDWALQ